MGVFLFSGCNIFISMSEEKRGKGRPRKTMEALVRRGLVPETWREDIIQLGREGKNKLHFHNFLQISRQTFYNLMDRDPDFLDTINYALELSQEWWVGKVREGFENNTSGKMNATLWKYYMENVYRKDWRPAEQQIDITTGGDKLHNPDNNIIVEIIQPKKETDEDTSD